MMIGKVFFEIGCVTVVALVVPCWMLGFYHKEVKESIRHFIACCRGEEF